MVLPEKFSSNTPVPPEKFTNKHGFPRKIHQQHTGFAWLISAWKYFCVCGVCLFFTLIDPNHMNQPVKICVDFKTEILHMESWNRFHFHWFSVFWFLSKRAKVKFWMACSALEAFSTKKQQWNPFWVDLLARNYCWTENSINQSAPAAIWIVNLIHPAGGDHFPMETDLPGTKELGILPHWCGKSRLERRSLPNLHLRWFLLFFSLIKPNGLLVIQSIVKNRTDKY